MYSPSCEATGRSPTVEEAKALFRAQGVIHGFDDHILGETLTQRRFNQEVTVARAAAAVNGQGARIQSLVEPDCKADFREIGTLVQVKAETVLAIKHPASTVSADGLSLVAAKSGCLFLQSGRLSVSESSVIGGGVKFKPGKIRFECDVEVQGCVVSGGCVTCYGAARVVDLGAEGTRTANSIYFDQRRNSSPRRPAWTPRRPPPRSR